MMHTAYRTTAQPCIKPARINAEPRSLVTHTQVLNGLIQATANDPSGLHHAPSYEAT